MHSHPTPTRAVRHRHAQLQEIAQCRSANASSELGSQQQQQQQQHWHQHFAICCSTPQPQPQPPFVPMDSSGTENTSTAPSFAERLRSSLARELQIWLDRSVPHALARWIAFAVVLLLVCVRILLLQGFYIIAYAYGIFLLHLFIGFLSPARDPDSEEGLVLPTHDADEFKPFVRRLPEFKFWYSSMKASVVSLVATFFSIFDIPVFWPVLLIYFIALVFMTMRRQIKHMIRHKYIPISTGKKKYRGPATSSGSSRPIKGKD